jgi:hypothetical protein
MSQATPQTADHADARQARDSERTAALMRLLTSADVG